MREPGHPAKRRRWIGITLWCVLVPLCLLLSLGWVISAHVMMLDLLASMQAQLSVIVALCLGVGVALRRWRYSATVLLLLVFSLYPISVNRVYSLPGVDTTSPPGEGVLRVVSVNINPLNEQWSDDLSSLMELHADVIVVIEVPPSLNGAIRKHGLLENTRYPYWAHRKWVEFETSPGFILSRWPIERIETGPDQVLAQSALHVRVQAPAGDLLVCLLHPLSPRTKSRWILGNGVIDLQADAIVRAHETTGLPVLIGADLNSSPAQVRARTLRTRGIRQCKPLFRIGGSFPANQGLPDFFKVQLDDIWRLGGIEPVGWSAISVPGSDHDAVIADFVIHAERN